MWVFTTPDVSKFASPTLMGLGFKKGGDNSNDGFKKKKVGSRIYTHSLLKWRQISESKELYHKLFLI